jgi:hypothetical protein
MTEVDIADAVSRTFTTAKGPGPTRQGEQVKEEKMTTFPKILNGSIGKPFYFV